MRNFRFCVSVGLVVLLFLLAIMGHAQQICVNEDFEGTDILVDQNWANYRQSAMPTLADIGKKGLNIAYVDGVNTSPETKSLKYNDPAIYGSVLGGGPGIFGTSYGSTVSATVVTDRHFKGSKSLALRPRFTLDPLTSTTADLYRWHLQDFATTPVLPNQNLARGNDWLVQFALGVGPFDPARTVGSPYGICQITLLSTITPTSTTRNAAASLRFYTVAKQDGNVDLILAAPRINGLMTTVTTLSPASGSWALVSILYRANVGIVAGAGTQAVTASQKTATPGTWDAIDTVTNGPAQPITKGPSGPYQSGITIYCNSNTPSIYLSHQDLCTTNTGASADRYAFGNDGFGSDQIDGNLLSTRLDDNLDRTGLIAFEIGPWNNRPESGAPVGTTTPHDEVTYIDDLYIGSPAGTNNTYFGASTAALNAEIAARIHDCGATSNEQIDPSLAGARDWNLY